MNSNTGPFEGMKRFDARYKVIEELKKAGLYEKWENNAMKVPLCSKTKDIIEREFCCAGLHSEISNTETALMKPQWWMEMKGMANEALAAVDDGRIKIRPDTADRSYHRWLTGITDWCLSRQL